MDSTIAFQVQPKKNVVLSGEAMKEMAKQAKANKEERRLQCDARHNWIFEKLANSLSIEIAAVEDAVLSDERFDLIEEFLAADGSRKLLFYYQEPVRDIQSRNESSSLQNTQSQRKLMLTTGTAEPLIGVCYFFLRSTDKAISTANIGTELNFGSMDCSAGRLLQGFQTTMSKILLPALQAQEVRMQIFMF
ncbi:dynein axonemal heavy chain 5-like [Tubulanus polymorphus]|uniref:dynein axonemal heavy chain 5-like n=1 Tax=Tubulanus polymorphus TaxID=672921 RepID=UPI003DA34367